MTESDFPHLAAMGILNPLRIDRYQINGFENHDVLRIIYERGEGGFLTSSRTFDFPRVQNNRVIAKDGKQAQTVLETHPDLRKAKSELEDLLATKEHKECVAESVLDELEALEEEMSMRTAYIKSLLKKL